MDKPGNVIEFRRPLSDPAGLSVAIESVTRSYHVRGGSDVKDSICYDEIEKVIAAGLAASRIAQAKRIQESSFEKVIDMFAKARAACALLQDICTGYREEGKVGVYWDEDKNELVCVQLPPDGNEGTAAGDMGKQHDEEFTEVTEHKGLEGISERINAGWRRARGKVKGETDGVRT